MLLCTAHALSLFPLAWMLMASFMQTGEGRRAAIRLNQYRTLFSRLDLAR